MNRQLPWLRCVIVSVSVSVSTLLCTPLRAQTTLESIALKHVSPQTLIDKLNPKLLQGEFVTATGNGILLSADAPRMATLRKEIETIDRPVKRFLLETRLGRLEQLSVSDSANSDISVSNRGGSGVVVISGASGPQEARVLSQSMDVQEATRFSLALGQRDALRVKTMAYAKGNSQLETGALKLEAQSGAWLAVYTDNQEMFLEVASRTEMHVDEMTVHQVALLPIKPEVWTTVAEAEDNKQPSHQRLVLQVKLSPLKS